jgi:hypothetical protein
MRIHSSVGASDMLFSGDTFILRLPNESDVLFILTTRTRCSNMHTLEDWCTSFKQAKRGTQFINTASPDPHRVLTIRGHERRL